MAIKASHSKSPSQSCILKAGAAGALLLGCFFYLRSTRPGDFTLERNVSLRSDGADQADAIAKCIVSPPVRDSFYGVEKCLSDIREKLMSSALDQMYNLPLQELIRFQGSGAHGWTPKWSSFDLFQPTYTCNPMHFIRTAAGDGGKWLCLDKLNSGGKQECVVFSLGCNGNFAFEQAMKVRFPQCKIHTFDCTGVWNDSSTTFHPWCIAGEDKVDSSGRKYTRMSSILKELGIDSVSLLKIDVENYEWPFFADLATQDERSRPVQVLVEFHAGCPSKPQSEPFNLVPSLFGDWEMNWVRPAVNMLRLLKSLGYRIAFQERNPFAECASEFVLIHEKGL